MPDTLLENMFNFCVNLYNDPEKREFYYYLILGIRKYAQGG